MNTQYDIGTYIDLTKTDFAARGAALASKSDTRSDCQILFDYIQGRMVSRRRIAVQFA